MLVFMMVLLVMLHGHVMCVRRLLFWPLILVAVIPMPASQDMGRGICVCQRAGA